MNKHIAELRKQSAQKNARYKAVKLKADELSQAANEIEQYLRQEQSRERQKKKNRVCWNNRFSGERSVNTEMFP